MILKGVMALDLDPHEDRQGLLDNAQTCFVGFSISVRHQYSAVQLGLPLRQSLNRL